MGGRERERERERRRNKKGGSGSCGDLPRTSSQQGLPDHALEQWHWLPLLLVAAPCNLTLDSPGRPTAKKLKQRQQLAVGSKQLPLCSALLCSHSEEALREQQGHQRGVCQGRERWRWAKERLEGVAWHPSTCSRPPTPAASSNT